MNYITVEQLQEKRQELVDEKNHKILILNIGYDNAIALLDELIEKAQENDEEGD